MGKQQKLDDYLKTRRMYWPYDGKYSLEALGKHKYVAKIDKELAGLAWADETAPGEAQMHMDLKQEFAEYGIGTELLETLMADLRDSGFDKVRYEIDAQYYSYQIYNDLGFRIESRDEEKIRFIWER